MLEEYFTKEGGSTYAKGDGKVKKRVKNKIGPYYNCNKLGHLIADCPEMKSKSSISKKLYEKKAMKATWDLQSESKEDINTVNVCFMAQKMKQLRQFLNLA